MKILLVMPNFVFNQRLGAPYPIGVGYLASVLKERGYQVKIIDCQAMRIKPGQLKNIFLEESPQLIGLTSTSHSRFNAVEIINLAKSLLPQCRIVVGGPHFTATAEDALRVVKGIDFVVRGEGEDSLLELAQAIEEKKGFENIQGISWRQDGVIRHNQDRPLIKDLDSLPMLNRDLFEEKFCFERLPHSEMPCKSVLASRGCPFGCAFCFLHERSYRRRSTGNILEEVTYLLERYKIEAIRFFDLTFTMKRETVVDFCQAILKRRLRFKWYCESRVDIDLGLLDLMKEAGCYSIDFGLESASPKVLKLINKRITPQQALEFAKKCRQLDIKTRVFLMLSLPGEERKDAEETYKFACQLSKYVSALGMQVTQVIPGTEVESRAKKLGILPADFSWHSPYKSPQGKIFSGTDVLPLYRERLSLDDLAHLYRKYSVFDIYNLQGLNTGSLKTKFWNGLTKWDKGILFKAKWLFLFLRYGLLRLLRREL